ncbi:uncharacterized protein LOC128728542 [Anopheles nili]|uniref:uncharacterized protein LOC128728542 n=1 Tax=Anopheles nili TaxID=185578 RepID=UPI00237A8ACD|nr:uncharacterized protein LOC128728542 [Anopheles nili]
MFQRFDRLVEHTHTRHRLLAILALLYICTLAGCDLTDVRDSSQDVQPFDELLESVFATINRIDIVNGFHEDTPGRRSLEKFFKNHTVRWYDVDLSTLCNRNLEEACYLPQNAHKLRSWWDENQQGGYVIYGDMTILTKSSCLFDPAGTYLLATHSTEPVERTQLLELLQLVWFERGAFRVYVRIRDAVYTYDPFQRTTSAEYGVLVELESWTPFPRVPSADFAGYPLRIEVFRSVYSNPIDDGPLYHGADVTARDVFSRALNVTVLHVPADRHLFGDRLPNGSFSGALGRLIRREVDIVFTGFFIKDYATRDVDFTPGVYSDAVCCLVKKASRIPEALLPLYIFPGDIWALLCLLGVFSAGVWCALRCLVCRLRPGPAGGLWSRRQRLAVLFNLPRNLSRDATTGRLVWQLYIDTFVLLVSAPYLRFTRSGVERLFLTGLLLVSLIFVSLYQSGLAAVFVNPLYHRDVNSLQQLDATGMLIPVKYRGFLDDVFPVNYSRLMESLRGRMRHLPAQESMLARVARLGNIATVTRRTTLALDNAIYMTTRQLHMVPECPRTYNLAYVVPRRSVFGELFSRVLLRMVGGGLVDHWIEEARYEWTLRDWRVVRGMMESNFKVLTVQDLQFAFYVLAIGLAVGVGAIGVELVWFRWPGKTRSGW